MSDPTIREGRVPFKGHHTWYRVAGEGEQAGKRPLLCLHGGPGCPHDYLQSLDAVVASGRRVIYYDQLGCGESEIAADPSMWTVELYVEEVGVVRDALGLDEVHLLGQSWGGMLALEYALTQPAGLASLVLASTLSSARHWAAETSRLRAELPADVQARLDELEAAGLTDEQEYRDLSMEFNRRHVCRSETWPELLTRSFDRMSQEVYGTMWGPSEFNPTGTLRDWSVTERLGEIRVPTLVTSGRHDESTPAINAVLRDGIPAAEQIIYEHSAHCSHLEEPDAYVRDLVEFLDRVDGAR